MGLVAGSPPCSVAKKRPFSVLVVIRSLSDGTTLLIERADLPGFWQSVTGSCEAHESVRQTAIREVAEETGLAVDPEATALRPLGLINVFSIYPEFRHRYAEGTTHNVEHCFLLDLPGPATPRLSAREHQSWRWCTFPEAEDRVRSWSNRAALQKVRVQLCMTST